MKALTEEEIYKGIFEDKGYTKTSIAETLGLGINTFVEAMDELGYSGSVKEIKHQIISKALAAPDSEFGKCIKKLGILPAAVSSSLSASAMRGEIKPYVPAQAVYQSGAFGDSIYSNNPNMDGRGLPTHLRLRQARQMGTAEGQKVHTIKGW